MANLYCKISSLHKEATCVGLRAFCWNCLLFLSFQIFHQKYIKIPSTFLFSFLSNLRLHLHQYECKEPEIFTDRNIAINWNHCFKISQTSLVNGQSLHKYTGVSSSFAHSLQSVSSVHPRLSRLFVVRIFFVHKSSCKKNDT